MEDQRWKVIDSNGNDHTTDLSQEEAEGMAKELENIFSLDYSIDVCHEREYLEKLEKEGPWRYRSVNEGISEGVDGHEDLYPEY